MKAGALDGAIPANVFENIRATVTAGLAKLVELVNQYAPRMYPPTANAMRSGRRDRAVPKTTSSKPVVAITSASRVPPVTR